MPATTPDAIARKQQRKNARRKAPRESVPTFVPPAPIGTGRKWRIGPPAPVLSKRELREMLATAMITTAGM